MESDALCRLTKPDGSVIELWLPAGQAEKIADVDHPYRSMVFETLDVVSIEIARRIPRRPERYDKHESSHIAHRGAG